MVNYLEEYLEVIQLPIHRAIWERAALHDVLSRLASEPDGVKQTDRNGKLPLHYAIEMNSSFEIVRALLNAYPQGAAVAEKSGSLALHRAIELFSPANITVALLSSYSGAARVRHRDKKLPLLKAIECQASQDVLIALVKAYPEGAESRDSAGRLPIHICLHSHPLAAREMVAQRPSLAQERDLSGLLPFQRALELRAPTELLEDILMAYPESASVRGKDNSLPLQKAIDNGRYPSSFLLALLRSHPDAAKAKTKDGYTALHRAIDKQCDVTVIRELIQVHPAGIYVATKDGATALHLALDKPEPLPIVRLLLEANADLAKRRDRSGILALNKVFEKPTDKELVLLILAAYPDGARTKGRDGNLPLHKAIEMQSDPEVTLAVIQACPSAAAFADRSDVHPLHRAIDKAAHPSVVAELLRQSPEAAWVRDKAGRLPIQKAMSSVSTEVYVSVLLPYNLPVNRFTGAAVEDPDFIWTEVLNTDNPPDKYLEAVRVCLEECADLVEPLSESLDRKGRRAMDIATPGCKKVIQNYLHFFGRYELRPGAAEHQSATCIVRIALDYQEERKPVALKFMHNRDQFLREIEIRSYSDLSHEFVINILRTHDGDEDTKFRAEVNRKKGFREYPYCLVMPAADRNLAAVLSHERIAGKDWEQIKILCKEIARALDYMHSKKLIHADIKRKR